MNKMIMLYKFMYVMFANEDMLEIMYDDQIFTMIESFSINKPIYCTKYVN